ncbi:MAG: hypothetical protein GY694_07465 [Gammaproteobacteria bacterium]|nr:hypothetical protein [Gammaproteobacteria bacterium]
MSIYDVGDNKFGSCRQNLSGIVGVKFEEIKLNTGHGHKIFKKEER